MEQLPFEITPQVQRYLEDILFLDKEYLFDKKYTGDAGRELFCLVKKEYPEELSTPKQRYNRHNFWMYLVKQNIVRCFFLGESLVENIKLSPLREKRLKDGKNIEIAISKNDKDEHPIRFYLAKPKSWKQDFYDLVNHHSYDYVVFQILDTKPTEELLEKIKSGKIENQEAENYKSSSKVVFDGQNAVLKYKMVSHKFQKSSMGDPEKLKLFKQLWDNRLHIRKGKKIAVGSALEPIRVAVSLNLASDRCAFEHNKEAQKKFIQLVKDVKTPLKKKGFPIEIKKKNGIQMIITEK